MHVCERIFNTVCARREYDEGAHRSDNAAQQSNEASFLH